MDVKLPNLGEGADSGTVVNVFVKVGDRVEKDQPLLELENEKAVATIPATASSTRVLMKFPRRSFTKTIAISALPWTPKPA